MIDSNNRILIGKSHVLLSTNAVWSLESRVSFTDTCFDVFVAAVDVVS